MYCTIHSGWSSIYQTESLNSAPSNTTFIFEAVNTNHWKISDLFRVLLNFDYNMLAPLKYISHFSCEFAKLYLCIQYRSTGALLVLKPQSYRIYSSHVEIGANDNTRSAKAWRQARLFTKLTDECQVCQNLLMSLNSPAKPPESGIEIFVGNSALAGKWSQKYLFLFLILIHNIWHFALKTHAHDLRLRLLKINSSMIDWP